MLGCPSLAAIPTSLTDPSATAASLGDRTLLSTRKLALFCSVRCPGKLILQTYDLARKVRDAAVTVIGGFHSPMEQECLRLILRGSSPVIVCPARGIGNMRVAPEWKEPLESGRLLVLSPFAAHERRVTRDLAARRNAFVAAVADALFVAYAEPGGMTEGLCRQALGAGKRVLTFDAPENAHLFALGAGVVGDNWSGFMDGTR